MVGSRTAACHLMVSMIMAALFGILSYMVVLVVIDSVGNLRVGYSDFYGSSGRVEDAGPPQYCTHVSKIT